jgi:4a-hydroxytetrahydrobiopterin dehydratase
MSELADKKCVPCTGAVPALRGSEIAPLLDQIPKWTLFTTHHIEREFEFPDFKTALDFVNKVGAVAEEQGHHPDIGLGWGRVEIMVYTHKVNGLTESDFILAAKIDRIAA